MIFRGVGERGDGRRGQVVHRKKDPIPRQQRRTAGDQEAQPAQDDGGEEGYLLPAEGDDPEEARAGAAGSHQEGEEALMSLFKHPNNFITAHI